MYIRRAIVHMSIARQIDDVLMHILHRNPPVERAVDDRLNC